MRETEPVRRWTITTIRIVLLALLVVLICDPKRVEKNDRLTVIALVDTSGSIRQFAKLPADPNQNIRDNLDYVRNWLRQAIRNRRPDDRVGLVTFDGRPMALATPTTGEVDDRAIDRRSAEGTNIAEAIRYGTAMFPPDTARRLVLLTDGNETSGDASAALKESAAGLAATKPSDNRQLIGSIPVDLVPIDYRVDHEVIVERVEVPRFGRPDQRITVRILLRSSTEATGRVSLKMEGEPVDLNGPDQAGSSRLVKLEKGLTVVTSEVTLDNAAVNRFQATFEPTDPSDDIMPGNNTAESFTISSQRGSVLIADGVYDGRGHFLGDALQGAGLVVKVVPADSIPHSLVELQAYDLVILQNVPAEDIPQEVQEHLVRYVNDLGGGLVMVGGYDSFGAGRWENTPIETLLPVSLRVPEELRIPTAAVALVLDRSGSMNFPVMGTRRTKQEIANEGAALAIESLDKNDYVAVYAFASFTESVVSLQKVDDPKRIADKVRTITPGGGTNILPAMRRAFNALRNVDAEIKHVVCLSDGQSQGQGFGKLAAEMKATGITVSSIAVGNDADELIMQEIADQGGGRYYFVRNPEILPRIFVKEIRVIRRPLIRETDFRPVLIPTGSPVIDGIDPVTPPLHGLVLTQPLKDDPTVNLLMTTPGGDEPILAYKQQGLGRTGAFTSDAHDQWARDWLEWSGYRRMWVQLARTVARPPGNRDYELQTTFQDEKLYIHLIDGYDNKKNPDTGEGIRASFPLTVPGFVYTPDGRALAVKLRQTGPGFYSASVPATQGGNYAIALTPRRGSEKIGLVLGGISRPTGIEYRATSSHTDHLASEIRKTGGRVLNIQSPDDSNLFDPDDIPETMSITPMWPTLLWWVIALWLADVAIRRIAWDGQQIRRRFAQAMTHARRAPARAEEAVDTLRHLREKGNVLSEHRSQSLEAQKGSTRCATDLTAQQSSERFENQPAPARDQTEFSPASISGALNDTSDKRSPLPDKAKMEPTAKMDEQKRAAAQRKGLAALKGNVGRVATPTDDAPGPTPDPKLANQRGGTTDADSPTDSAEKSYTPDPEKDTGAVSRLAALRREQQRDEPPEKAEKRGNR